MVQKLQGAGIPVVLIDRDLTPYPRRSDFDLVSMDNIAGGFAIGEHFIKLGCTRICFVHPPRSAPTIDGRIAGVRQALVGSGLDAASEWVFSGDVSDELFIRKILAKGKPQAIVCSNDHTAALLLQGLAKLGTGVPEDVKVAGFDDVRFATLVSPPLTTVQQPYREIAVAAFRAMMSRIREPQLPARQINFAPRLVIRDSCGAYL